MANTNSPFGKGGLSSLLRSASSTATALADLKDQQMAYDYGNSDYTDSAFSNYSKYLKDRINGLSSSSKISDQAKAQTLMSTLRSATRDNVRASIAQENIQMLAGNATTTNKLNMVLSQAARAQAIGDDTLYSQLETQAYSLSQTAQKEAADAQVASATIAKVNTALSNIPGYGGAPSLSGGSANQDWVSQIRSAAKKYGVDPQAALAVASAEGLSGGVGDGGTSFGPFQLHVGGALPAGKDRAWAESADGIDYALKTIAGVAKGLTGQAAVEAIVSKFERPANPTGEVARAMAVYGSPDGSLTSGQSALINGSATPSDIASNATDYAKSVADAEKKGAETLIQQVKDLNSTVTKIGTNGMNQVITKWVNDHADAFKTLGVDLPKDSKPNYGSILQGTYAALNKFYGFAAQAAAGTGDQSAVDNYTKLANSYATGDATLPVVGKGGKTMNLGRSDLDELAKSLANPGSAQSKFMQASDGSVIEKPQAGFSFDAKSGTVVPSYLANPYADVTAHPEKVTTSVQDKQGKVSQVPSYQAAHPYAYVSAPLDLTTTLNRLGLQFQASNKGYASQGTEAVVTNQSSDFVKKIAKPGTALQVYMSPNGLQFQAADAGGKPNNAVYTVVRDGRGLSALYENGPDGGKLLGGEYGFNWNLPTGQPAKGSSSGKTASGKNDQMVGTFNDLNALPPPAATTSSGHGMASGFIDRIMSAAHNMTFANMFGGNVHMLMTGATLRANEVHQQFLAEQNRIAAQAMLSAPAPALPQIQVNNSPAPSAPLPIYHAPALQPVTINHAVNQSVAPKTVNPQPASNISLQGGSFNLQGGGGIRLQ